MQNAESRLGLQARTCDRQETLRLQRRAADQAAVDVGLVEKAPGVVGLHAAAVLDAYAGGEVLVPRPGQLLADVGVDLLCLLVGGRATGADGPDRLVRDHHAVRVVHLWRQLAELAADHRQRLAGV